jgi:hypothetical protein
MGKKWWHCCWIDEMWSEITEDVVKAAASNRGIGKAWWEGDRDPLGEASVFFTNGCCGKAVVPRASLAILIWWRQDLLWHLHYDTPRVHFSELRQFRWTILHYLFHVLLILMSNGSKVLTLTIARGYIAPNLFSLTILLTIFSFLRVFSFTGLRV